MKYGYHWLRGYSAEILWKVNSCDLETKATHWPWHWHISIFVVNKVSVPNMIHQPSIVFKKLPFYIFPYECIEISIWPFHKKVKRQLRIIIWTNLVGIESQLSHNYYILSFKIPSFLVPEKNFQKIFQSVFFYYYIWAWGLSWSCDPDVTYN